jgi:abortive infection bacteriophage resistance protein
MTGLPAPPDSVAQGRRFFMNDIKPFLSYEEQVGRLVFHGCKVEDAEVACLALSQINYYRFSAYFLPFKQKNGKYKPGTSFNTVYRIYEFDRKLRTIVFAAIARIEVFLRSQFAYYHAGNYGPLGYMNAALYRANGHDHGHFLKQIDAAIKNNNKVLFVQHHIQNYDSKFPVWVITELFTFGMLSRFYADLQTKDQKMLARNMFGLSPQKMISWLRCCTDLRNNCAHHGRLYYRIFPASPAGFEYLDEKSKRQLFPLLLVLKSLYPAETAWENEMLVPLCALMNDYRSEINLQHIGFPEEWQETLAYNDNRI